MIRHHIYATSEDAPNTRQVFRDLVLCWQISQRMTGARANALSVHHLKPSDIREKLVTIPEHASMTSIQIHLHAQRCRDLHRAAIVPEIGIIALSGVIVQDDEISNALVLELGLPIEFVDVELTEAPIRKEDHQSGDHGLNQVRFSADTHLISLQDWHKSSASIHLQAYRLPPFAESSRDLRAQNTHLSSRHAVLPCHRSVCSSRMALGFR